MSDEGESAIDRVIASWKPGSAKRDDALAHIYGEVAAGRPLYRVISEDRREHGLPSYAEFWRWHMADTDVRDNLARARQNGADAWVDRAVAVSEVQEMGEKRTYKKVAGEDVMERVEEDMLGHRKLKVETYFKAAAMIAPRKYGPKVELKHSGAVAQPASKLSDDPNEAARQYRDLMAGLDGDE